MYRYCSTGLSVVAAVVALLGASTQALAQSNTSITGVVTDSVTGLPIADAVVRIVGSTESAETETNGSFALRSVPVGPVHLRVTRVGYRDCGPLTVDIVEGFTRRLNIALTRLPVRMPDQTIEHRKRMTLDEVTIRRYTRDEIVNAGHRTVGEALAAIPGVNVYGTAESPGGTRVSVGGERPHRVAVLFDGLPLAGGTDGAVDLDAIPLSAVAEIAVTPGAQSSTAGDAAIGGVVDIRTGAAMSSGGEATLRAGQHDHYNAALSGAVRLDPVTANIALEHTERGGHFDYPSGESNTERNGTGEDKWRAFLAVTPQSSSSLRLSGFYYGSEIGLPGALEQTTPNATNESSHLRIQGTWDRGAYHRSDIGAGVWYEESTEHFVSPVRMRADSELRERFIGGRTYVAHRLIGFDARVEIEGRERRLAGTDNLRPHLSFGVHDRTEFSLRSRLDRTVPIGSHVLSGTIAGTIDGDDVSSPSYVPRVDMGWSMPFGVHVRAGWGESFRRPLLTSLFWKADAYAVGNPDLKPERADEWEVGFGYRHDWLNIDTRYFERDVQNIIVWQRSTVTGQYKPLNIDRSQVIGREDHIGVRLFNDAIVLDYAHVYNGAYDHSGDVNYDSQTLILTPRHTHDASLSLRYDRWRLRTSGRWVSLRYIRRQNTPEKSLAPYRVFDARLRYTARKQSPTISIALEFDNLANEYYELLERYPAPGRQWSVTTSIAF
ncbi:MAG: TonB-dependent receptor [candidate division Zixibacteria bacterium]|nr:TonB-dependent receptor [candidate division Zixibacteria bacterium]